MNPNRTAVLTTKGPPPSAGPPDLWIPKMIVVWLPRDVMDGSIGAARRWCIVADMPELVGMPRRTWVTSGVWTPVLGSQM